MCTILGHKVRRGRVRKDGGTYLGRCKRCRVRMLKTPEEDWHIK